ncbi:YceI family protein [Roseivirga sp. E12]|uniref:YceI family protein n=1 Tax=Roseivirga sp. E12 TaxID=2819237 RepID=UPI001ABBFBA3|nr:YceI family protein [Roseivirga sp. E12]MBO3700557.1 YceI family protein [Roseivirga sp. E12]
MKQLYIIFFALLSLSHLSYAQDTSFWPDQVKHIPGLDTEIFSIDQSHSKLNFSIGFFGFSDVEGTFGRYFGTILYNEDDLLKTSITLLAFANTIDTGNNFRDKDLKKENFFDTENHKTLTFQSTRIEKLNGQLFAIGDLKIKGITKEVKVPFERTKGRFIDPFWSNLNIGFKGEVVINRSDFDIDGGRWGEKVLSEEVKISFSIVGKQPNTFKWGDAATRKTIDELVNVFVNEGSEAGKVKYLEVSDSLDAFITNGIASRLMQKYYFKEAIEFLELGIEKFPGRVNMKKDMARAYAFIGKREESIKFYNLVLESSPSDTEALQVIRAFK